MTPYDYRQAEADYERQQAARRAQELTVKAQQDAAAQEAAHQEELRQRAVATATKEQVQRAQEDQARNLQWMNETAERIQKETGQNAGGQTALVTDVTKFTPNPAWKPYQFDSQGKPNSYIDDDKIVHYAPNHSMYQFGWRETSSPERKEAKVRGDLTGAEKDELKEARKTWDKLMSKESLTESEQAELKKVNEKFSELDVKTRQRGLAGHWLSQDTEGEYAGRVLGEYTISKRQAGDLKDLAQKEDWEGIFQYEKKLGIVQPEALSPNERYVLETTMRGYMFPDGGYDMDRLVKDISQGKTIVNYHDIARYFGAQKEYEARKAVKEYGQSENERKARETTQQTLGVFRKPEVYERERMMTWERDTLPKLPDYVQSAYSHAKETGDYTNFDTQFHKYQQTIGYSYLAVAALKEQSRKQQTALDQLKNYKGASPAEFFPYSRQTRYENTYDIAKYLRDHPDDVKTLKTAGFEARDIKVANEYNVEYNKPMPAEQFVQRYYSEKGWDYKKDRKALKIEAIEPGSIFTAKKGDFARPVEAQNRMKEANQAYIDKYGKGTAAQSTAGELTSMVFAPARLIEPGIKPKDISGEEWAIGGAQLATMVLPFMKGIPLTVVSAGAGGVFTYYTIKNAKNMSPSELALSIAMDTLVLLPAITASSRFIRSKVDPLGTKTKQLIKAQGAQNEALAQRIRENYGNEPADALLARNKAQSEYIDAIMKQQKGKRADIEAAAADLEAAERKYSEALLKRIGEDMPGETLRDTIKRSPSEIRRMTDAAFERATTGKESMSVLRKIVERTQTEYQETVRRVNADFQKYRAGMPKTQEAQFKIAQKWKQYEAQIGQKLINKELAEARFRLAVNSKVFNYQSKINELNRQIDIAKEVGKEAKGTKGKLNAYKRLKKLEEEKAELFKKVKDFEKYVHPETPRPGGGGGVGTMVKAPEKVSGSLAQELKQKGHVVGGKIVAGGGVRNTRTQEKTFTTTGYTTKRIPEVEGNTAEIQKIEPLTVSDINSRIQEIYKGKEVPDVQSDIQSITQNVNKELTKTQTETKTRQDMQQRIDEVIKENIKENIRPAISPSISPKPQTQPQVKTELNIKTDIPTKEPEPGKRLPQGDKLNKKDKDTREAIKEGLGSFFYTRGKLDAPVHHVWYVGKDGKLYRTILRGPTPDGSMSVSGKGSARMSLKRFAGKRLPNARIIEDTGGSDTIVSVTGNQLSIDFVGNITGKGAQITQRAKLPSRGVPRLSRGMGRISPRMPRLR